MVRSVATLAMLLALCQCAIGDVSTSTFYVTGFVSDPTAYQIWDATEEEWLDYHKYSIEDATYIVVRESQSDYYKRYMYTTVWGLTLQYGESPWSTDDEDWTTIADYAYVATQVKDATGVWQNVSSEKSYSFTLDATSCVLDATCDYDGYESFGHCQLYVGRPATSKITLTYPAAGWGGEPRRVLFAIAKNNPAGMVEMSTNEVFEVLYSDLYVSWDDVDSASVEVDPESQLIAVYFGGMDGTTDDIYVDPQLVRQPKDTKADADSLSTGPNGVGSQPAQIGLSYLGYNPTASKWHNSGWRFDNVTIGDGDVIQGATLEITKESGGSPTFWLCGEYKDNAPDFVGNTAITTRVKTSKKAYCTLNSGKNTYDVTNIVREIQSRQCWGAGNSFVFLAIPDGNTARGKWKNYASNAPATLVISHHAPSTPSAGQWIRHWEGESQDVDTYVVRNCLYPDIQCYSDDAAEYTYSAFIRSTTNDKISVFYPSNKYRFTEGAWILEIIERYGRKESPMW